MICHYKRQQRNTHPGTKNASLGFLQKQKTKKQHRCNIIPSEVHNDKNSKIRFFRYHGAGGEGVLDAALGVAAAGREGRTGIATRLLQAGQPAGAVTVHHTLRADNRLGDCNGEKGMVFLDSFVWPPSPKGDRKGSSSQILKN